VKGVRYEKGKLWGASWVEGCKQHCKYFAVSKYGYDEARAMAITVRKEKEETLPEYKLAYCT
jgi:hypothetical protein